MNNSPIICGICNEENHYSFSHIEINSPVGPHSRAVEKICCYCFATEHICLEHDPVHWAEQSCCICGNDFHVCCNHYDEDQEDDYYHNPVFSEKEYIPSRHIGCDCLI